MSRRRTKRSASDVLTRLFIERAARFSFGCGLLMVALVAASRTAPLASGELAVVFGCIILLFLGVYYVLAMARYEIHVLESGLEDREAKLRDTGVLLGQKHQEVYTPHQQVWQVATVRNVADGVSEGKPSNGGSKWAAANGGRQGRATPRLGSR